MLESILPAGVECQECFGEPPGGVLFAEEEQVIAHAVPARRREYADVRSCARVCLGRLGYPQVPILPGVGGAPIWPAGVRGQSDSLRRLRRSRSRCIPTGLRDRYRRRTRRTTT